MNKIQLKKYLYVLILTGAFLCGAAHARLFPILSTAPVLMQQAYLKASNTDAGDQFGHSVAISGDTLVVGTFLEASNATGINGDESDDSAPEAGGVYVYIRDGDQWSQQAYIKASNTDAGDHFGGSVAISGDTLVVGASTESSRATGVNGDQSNNAAPNAGAAYVFTRSGTEWTQQAYIKASNAEAYDVFGGEVAISGDSMVVTAIGERSNAAGVNGNQGNNSLVLAGAAYVFVRDGTEWIQQAYLKASNPDAQDRFGWSGADISGDTVAIGAVWESSNATGINGDQSNNSAFASGAVYVYHRNGSEWSQQAFIKASNSDEGDNFGTSLDLDGTTLVVGAFAESSNATGINGYQHDDSAPSSGAAYVFTRRGTQWHQQAYLKASNTNSEDYFGNSVVLSGHTLVVTAFGEASNATGTNGDQQDNSAQDAGAAYVFHGAGWVWAQKSYLKASNTESGDFFGTAAGLSGDTLVVGADFEASKATDIDGDQADNSASEAGAAYVFSDDRLFTDSFDIEIEDLEIADPELRACILDWAVQLFWTLPQQVTWLDCSGRGISSLDGLEHFTNLVSLTLENNLISDLSPLAGLDKLNWLNFARNNVIDLSPLQQLRGLYGLWMFQNQVENLEPLSDLTKLGALEGNNNNISSLEPLRDHQNFHWLTVADNPLISDISPIQDYTGLEVFNIAGNPLVTDLSPLQDKTTLNHLNLDRNLFTEADLVHVQNLTNLISLTLQENQIADLNFVQNLDKLQTLTLQQNRITDVTPLLSHTQLVDLWLTEQQYPPGLDCSQQSAIDEALPTTKVYVDGVWDDPDDVPDQGDIECFIDVVDVPIADAVLETCIKNLALLEGWVKAREVTHFECIDMGISSLAGAEYFYKVEGIDVAANQISDLSPLQELNKLFNLNVADNLITDVAALGNLPILRHLWVLNNQISSIEPLRNVQSLALLDMRNNNVSSLAPLENHLNFEQLGASANNITDISPLQNMTVLYTLLLDENQIADFSVLENLTNMTWLDINGTGFSDTSVLANMTRMWRVTMARNNVTDITPVQNMPNLEQLWIWDNNISDLSPLTSLTKIRHIDAGINQISDLTPLQNKPLLEGLLLDQNRISDVTPILSLTQLNQLWLRSQENPPGLNCVQQQAIVAGLPSTTVLVDGFWDDPNDNPDLGNIDCFP